MRSWSVWYFIFVLLLRKIGKQRVLSYWGYAKTITPSAVPARPKACYFTGAGVYLFWQIGAAKYLQENCNLAGVDIIGASAGSLTGLLLLSGVDFDKATEIALTQTLESGVYAKPQGLAGELGALLEAWLDSVVPQNLDMDAVANLYVAIAPAALKPPKIVSGFANRTDVIRACMASCHVPIFMDGRATTDYRGESIVDGSFWYFVTKNRFTGLPLPSGIQKEDCLWIDYTDDDEFMSSIDGNFLAIQSQEGIYDMIQSGYNHLKREHFYGRLPLARYQRPSYVISSLYQKYAKIIEPYAIEAVRGAGAAVAAVTSDKTSEALKVLAGQWKSLPDTLTTTAAASTTTGIGKAKTGMLWGVRIPQVPNLKSWRVDASSLSLSAAPSSSSSSSASATVPTSENEKDDFYEYVSLPFYNGTTPLWPSTFASAATRWFYASKENTSSDGLGSALVNLLVMSIVFQATQLV